jgi:hypothetical protein
MDRRKELVAQYKELKTYGGVYQIRNTINGKIFVDSTRNLRSLNGKMIQLELGSMRNKKLQQDWDTFGKDAFVIEVLEELEMKTDDYGQSADQLKKMEEKWLEKLLPYDEKGYNR